MATMTEQFSEVTRANLESQVSFMTAVSNKMFEGMQKIIDLNIQAARTSMDESNETIRQLMSAKGPQEFLSMSTQQTKPNLEKAMSYGRHVANITSTTQAEITKVAEEQLAESNRKVIGLVEQAAQNAPAGSENVISLMKSAINTANTTYEQLSKSTRQAADAMQSNVSNAVNQFSSATANTTDSVQSTVQQTAAAATAPVTAPNPSAVRSEKQR
jgi:phasin family protein